MAKYDKYVKIDMKPVNEVIEDLGFNRTGKVQIEATRLARQFMEPYVPKLEGNLREEAQENYDEIIYGPRGSISNAYASIVYHLPQEGTHWTTPGTGSFWDVRMMADRKEQFYNTIQEFADKQKDSR